MTPLEEDALAALKMLCFDRGVILSATCVDDSRQLFNAICEKHGVDDRLPHNAWAQGTTMVKPIV